MTNEIKEMDEVINSSKDLSIFKRSLDDKIRSFNIELSEKWKLFELSEYIRKNKSQLKSIGNYRCKFTGGTWVYPDYEAKPSYVEFFNKNKSVLKYKVVYYYDQSDNINRDQRRGEVEYISIDKENIIVAFNVIKIFANKIKEINELKKQSVISELEKEKFKRDYLSAVDSIEV